MKMINYFHSLSLVFLFFIFNMLVNSPIENNHERMPANTSDCNTAMESMLDSLPNQHVKVHEGILKGDINKFWKQHDGTYVGSIYYKGLKSVFKKFKTTFMDINSNYRPIFYVENDQASYPKIFKYIELKSANPDNTDDLGPLEKEITGWIENFKNYPDDMETLVSQFSVNGSYIKRLREFKKDKSVNYPFNIELDLYTDAGPKTYKRFISSESEIDELILYLKNKQKSLKGTSFFRVGKIDNRDLEQALLQQRLKYLETEIYSYIATNPNAEETFKELLRDLIKINRDDKYKPTLQYLTKLEYKEMKSEYEELFKNEEVDFKKLDEFSKKVLENLSPYYQKKLGITDAKNWVSMMKMGRTGVLVAGIGSGGLGGGALFMRLWNWYNYDRDSEFNIVNAADEDTFRSNLKKYLKGKFKMDLIIRLYAVNDNEMGLKDYNPKIDNEVEILSLVNEIISQRKQFKKEEKLLTNLEEQLTSVVDGVQKNAEGEVTKDAVVDTHSNESSNTSTTKKKKKTSTDLVPSDSSNDNSTDTNSGSNSTDSSSTDQKNAKNSKAKSKEKTQKLNGQNGIKVR